jgi:hypothetical protein
MKKGTGIPMPKDREKGNSMNFDELSTVKIIGDKVLMLHTIAADENTVCDNLNWRVKTFDSFRKKVMNVAEDYTGGVDKETIIINDPVIMDIVEKKDEEQDPNPKVLVNFSAIIPTNIGRKELN